MDGFLVLIGIAVGFVTLVIITRPFTILFHELGHAIPGMLLTKKGANIFIGSYGDTKQSFKVEIGSLEIWFRYNPLNWSGGLCLLKAQNISKTTRVIVLLGGVIFSLIICFSLVYLTLHYNIHGLIKLICVFMLFSSSFDLVYNLFPHVKKDSKGNFHFTDGFRLFYKKKLSKKLTKAIELYDTGEFKNASKKFEELINTGIITIEIYRFAANSFILTKKYEKAIALLKEAEKKHQLDANDYYHLGISCFNLNLTADAEQYFQKSLEKDSENINSLNAIGYILITEGKYKDAILIFDKTLQIKNDFAFAYNNRGQAKLENGSYEEGLKDINQSILLDKTNSFAYRNLGIYYLKKKDKKQALKYFLQAKEMDEETELINEYIMKASYETNPKSVITKSEI